MRWGHLKTMFSYLHQHQQMLVHKCCHYELKECVCGKWEVVFFIDWQIKIYIFKLHRSHSCWPLTFSINFDVAPIDHWLIRTFPYDQKSVSSDVLMFIRMLIAFNIIESCQYWWGKDDVNNSAGKQVPC